MPIKDSVGMFGVAAASPQFAAMVEQQQEYGRIMADLQFLTGATEERIRAVAATLPCDFPTFAAYVKRGDWDLWQQLREGANEP